MYILFSYLTLFLHNTILLSMHIHLLFLSICVLVCLYYVLVCLCSISSLEALFNWRFFYSQRHLFIKWRFFIPNLVLKQFFCIKEYLISLPVIYIFVICLLNDIFNSKRMLWVLYFIL